MQAFAAFLAVINALVSAQTSLALSPHLTLISLAVFSVYAYRDLWPLMTYTLRPIDRAEGNLLWIKVALSAWAGVLGPLLEPYPYIPIHPQVSATQRLLLPLGSDRSARVECIQPTQSKPRPYCRFFRSCSWTRPYGVRTRHHICRSTSCLLLQTTTTLNT